MNKIKIAHLYYDLMNLYGEVGNIKALVKTFEEQSMDCLVDNLTIGDEFDLKKYDIIYIGCGTENNQLIVLEDIMKYKNDFKKLIDKGKFIICTGNSYELFGKYILKQNGKQYDTLDIFDFYAKEVNERIRGEQIVECDFLKDPLIGFHNRQCIMSLKDNHLFTVTLGHAENYKSKYEGIHYNNFLGTYLIGPILIRNPHLTNYIVEQVLNKKNIDYIPITNTLDFKAYNEFIKNFIS